MNELNPFYRGDDLAIELVVSVKGSDTPLDITGWQFISSMKLSSELPDQPELDDQGNRQVLNIKIIAEDNDDSKNGRVYLLYPSEKTRQLIPTSYEIDIQSNREEVTQTLMKSVIQVLSDVSHGEPQ